MRFRLIEGLTAARGGICGLLLVVAPAAFAGTAAAESFTLSGSDVRVFNLVGPIQVVAGSGSDVVVEVTKFGRDADKVRVETGPIDGRSTLRVIYPGKKIIYPEMSDWGNTSMRVNDDGTFNLKYRDSRMVTISGRGSGTEAHATIVVRVPAGRTLGVFSGVGKIDARDVSGDFRLDTGASSVTASNIKGSLNVDVGSGDVSVTNVQGSVQVDTGSGDVLIEGVTGERLSVDTGSGGVSGRDIRVTDFLGDTGSGDIEIRGLSARKIGADTGSGSVELELTADAESVSIDTGSGDVRLAVPREFGARLSVSVGSGDIDVTIPMAEIRKSEDSVTGRIGDGAGHVTIETGSGGVVVAAK